MTPKEWYPAYFLFCSIACTVFQIIFENFAYANLNFASAKVIFSLDFGICELPIPLNINFAH